ncbi:MAG: DNA repair protein RecO [Elusimicrobia bacterium]|nr:DNA repair protein RecO [Elusimicrobiota bacterium]
MGFTKTEAIVLRARELREADSLITLYTRDWGKVQVVAKGLRKVKARYGASLEIFTHNQVMLFSKTDKDMAKLTGCQVMHPFYSLRESYFKYGMASYLLELVDKLSEYREANQEIFNLLGKSFSLMDAGVLQTRENYLSLWNWFVLKILDYSGYKVSLESCIHCKEKPALDKPIVFSLMDGGIVCRGCLKRTDYVFELNPEVWAKLRLLQKSALPQLMSIDITAETRLAIKILLEKYAQFICGDSFNCQEFFFSAANKS